MDSDNIFDEPSSAPKNEGIGLMWKVVIAVAALAVIGFVAVSFLQQEPDSTAITNETPTTVSSAAQSVTPTGASDGEPELATAEEYFQQGNGYVQSGQLQEAVRAYQKAIELDPDYQAVYANLGVVYYQLEQLDLATENYARALELNPNDGEVTYNMGALTLQRALLADNPPDSELLNQAIAQIEKSLELAPDLAEPYFSLGVAYLTLDQREAAIEAFENFLARDSGQDPRASQEAQRYLDTLDSQ